MNCRSCGQPTIEIFSLGRLPLANSLLRSPDEPYKTYPLDLVLCQSCSLVQLAETVPPEEMFVDYAYLTSCSPPMVEHAKSLVDSVYSRIPLTSQSLVAEIGSNDGYLLRHYDSIPVLGIDPSIHAADAADALGIPTVREFFSFRMAESLGQQADVIHANNVLAHVPDLNDFVAGLARFLAPSGTIIIEVPDLRQLIEKAAFDTVYHEHVYYFSITALATLFSRYGLVVNDVQQISTHGGSLRLWITKSGGPNTETRRLLSQESFFIRSPGYYSDFSRRAEMCRSDTYELLSGRAQPVAGFGAAAKATIFLNYCGITASEMCFVADDTPTKQGKFIPGTGIPIVPTADWLTYQPDATMVLCWNFAHAVAHKYCNTYKGKLFTWYTPQGVAA